MKRLVLRLLPALLGALTLACGGAGSGPGPMSAQTSPAAGGAGAPATPLLRGTLTVFAAASLTDAFEEIGREFRKEHPGVRPAFNFAASTALRTQLEQGARADLFASADQVQMDAAKRSGVVDAEARLFAKNRLIVIAPAANPAKIESVEDLARPSVKLVLTDRNVPIGAYARATLERLSADPRYGADFGRSVLANLRSEEANVRAVVTKVQLGEADAAIVYASDVTPEVAARVRSIPIPEPFSAAATYPIAVVKDAPNRAAARAFVEFVRSARGQAILAKHNFIVDSETGSA